MSISQPISPVPHGPRLLQSNTAGKSSVFAAHSGKSLEQWKSSPRILRFGPFEANFDRRELRKHGMKIRLEDKPFEILEALLREPGRLVSRDELRAKLWPDTFVTYDHCLNTAVNRLREALGDSSHSFRFIETVRRRGYRFTAAVGLDQQSQARQSRLVLLLLPFRTFSVRAAESFAQGLAEEISSQVAALDSERLGMLSPSAALGHRGGSITQIGETFGADLLLEGSVRCSGNRVRVGVQLVRASDQLCCWSEMYERSAAVPLTSQADIAQRIAAAVAAKLGLSMAPPYVQPNAPALALRNSPVRRLGS